MRPEKHGARYRQIAAILADEGFDTVLDSVGLRRFAPMHRSSHTAEEPTGVRIRRTLERLGPAFVKVGQILSTRADLLPPDVIDELRKLQDAVPPVPFEEIEPTFIEDLGAPPEAVYARFDKIPIAAASLGQVYSATLNDGREVAVKVQRPDVERLVQTDLDILLSQARFAEDHIATARRYSAYQMASEFARAIRAELDYAAEAHNAERFREAFASDPTVVFPEVMWEYSTARILTLERLNGVPLNRPEEIRERGWDLEALARVGIYSYLRQVFDLGFFHADPHPGNLIALEDGRVGFTDLGRVGSISLESRERIADLFVAVVDRDSWLATETLLDLSMSGRHVDPQGLERDVRRLIGKYYEASLDEIRVGDLMREVLGVVRDHHIGISSEFALLLSTLGVLEGVGMQLDPGFSFVEATRPFAERLVRERMSAAAMGHRAASAARRLVRVLGTFPETLDRVLRRASEGEFRLAARLEGQDPLMLRLEELVDRLAFALVVSAFVVGLSVLLSGTVLPGWFTVAARVALGVSLAVGLWFFVSLLGARRRSRHQPKEGA